MDAAALERELVRLRRRTAELEALFSTARELVRLQDVDEVLSRLVQRAHGLMGTDVTYLSELEPATGDLRVRHPVGTITTAFSELRVPSGVGLASKVVTTRAPAWVADYREMREAPHDDRIDAAVETEGLVSFLGVPLAVGDEVLGALFACNRFAHDFSPEQVLLLSAFADHASAVLHSARVIADRAAATTRAEEAYRSLEQHLAATETASAIHEELTTAVISGATVVDLVATVSRRLGRRVWALDEDGRSIGTARDGLPPRAALLDAAARSHAGGHTETIETDGRRWFIVAITGADRVVGSILAEREGAVPDDVTQRTLERAAQVAALVSFKRDAAKAIRAERRAAQLLGLLDWRGAGDFESDPQVVLPGPVVACAVLDVRGRGLVDAASLAVDIVGDDGLVAQRGDRLLVAWAVPEADARTERLRLAIAERLREPAVTAVVAHVGDGGRAIAASVDRATRDLGFLPSLGIAGVTVQSEAFAPYHLLSSSDSAAAEHFVSDLIGPVLTWDAERSTQLFETLAAYFDAGESRAVTATRMHVHKNTVQQRIERIEQLLPGRWDDAEFRFRVQVAVRLERLRRELRLGAVELR